jgi:hypothetical protein
VKVTAAVVEGEAAGDAEAGLVIEPVLRIG